MRYDARLYRPSDYNIIIPLCSGMIIYNGMGDMLQKLSATEQAIYELLVAGKTTAELLDVADNERNLSKIMEKFLQGRFILPKKSDEKVLFNKALKLLKNRTDSFGLTIAPTLACNFVCDYCFQGEHRVEAQMDIGVQNRLMDFIEERLEGKKYFSVAWYGGEPLLALGVIEELSKRIIELCKQKNCEYRASIVTNGYLLTESAARKLIKCRVDSVQITLDGDKCSHDSRRYIVGNIPTFDKIIANLMQIINLKELYFNIRVNIDKRNYNDIDGLLYYLQACGLSDKNNLSVYFAPVDICTEECLKISDEVLSAESYSRLETKLLEKSLRMKLCKASLPARIFSLCGAVLQNSFVILPNGDVHKCWNTVAENSQKVGNIDDPKAILVNSLYNSWVHRPMIKNDACYSCPILANCAGGCAAKDGFNGSSCISLRNNVRRRLIMYALDRQIIDESEIVE